MNKYRIDKFPTHFYLDQFNDDKIKVVNYPSEPPQACITIFYGEEDMEFDIYFPLENNSLSDKFIQIAKEVLSAINILDDRARQVPSPHDYEEHLAYIVITAVEIELHYFASTMNTEWGAFFSRNADGLWQFNGLG